MAMIKEQLRLAKSRSKQIFKKEGLRDRSKIAAEAIADSRPPTSLLHSFEINLTPPVEDVEINLVGFTEKLQDKDFIMVIEDFKGGQGFADHAIKCWPTSTALGKPFVYLKDIELGTSLTLPKISLTNGNLSLISLGIYQWKREYTRDVPLFDHVLIQGAVDLGNQRVGKLRKQVSW